ncbi:metal ABC transporter solute-binding protein, Zn/Mn family [Candidimonas nitroreducens]|uniref:Cation ABC transporter substrate-binding protein n=1 Tax=Candidimonas nitroreducens TaxID=683354 RepID=A0A225MZ61_9BURK|nr:zinc ABC transporter substrate-binding protein [Candidimonas nitroreducens]OWT66362.1 cation ABC transporter substrate-binding protein [Candidimonas nitroreducens]
MNRFWMRVAALVLTGLPLLPVGATEPIRIVAAENFYGDIAHQLGGPHVQVTSILSNPEQDPHLFEASASTAKALSGARLVVYNGIDYDPWMHKLLSASPSPERKAIVAGQLLGRKSGDNPHLWYDPATMPAVAKAISAQLEAVDPANRADYRRRLHALLESFKPMRDKIREIKARYAGTPVTATEPVFGYMADALGLSMRNNGFQLAVMNDTEPSASQMAAFENDLATARVKILFYNSQVVDQAAERARRIAQQHHVAVVGVTETQPAGKSYQDWMMSELAATERALSGK